MKRTNEITGGPLDLPEVPTPSSNPPLSGRLVDLFRTASEELLRPTLDRLFPEETDDLIAAFRRVREMEAAPDVELVLRLDRDGDDVIVGGADPKNGEDYALDLLPWAAYLGLTVPDALLAAFDANEVIAHVLGEMTFYGTPEESKSREPEGGPALEA